MGDRAEPVEIRDRERLSEKNFWKKVCDSLNCCITQIETAEARAVTFFDQSDGHSIHVERFERKRVGSFL